MSSNWLVYDRYREGLFRALKYAPSAEQEAFHGSRARIRQVAGGERGGKSYSSAMDGYCRSAWTVDGQPGKFWIVGPDYVQPRKEFDYVYEAAKEMGVVDGKRGAISMPTGPSSPWKMILKDGNEWETKTSADLKKLASEALDGIIMAEAAQQSYDVFLKLRGRVSERRGWLTLSGTFEQGLTWYVDLFNRWQGENGDGAESFSLPTWSNLAIYPGGRQDEEILKLESTYPPDLFLERFGAVPAKPFGLVFKEFEYLTHVSEVQIVEGPVYLAIDPGYAGAYAVLALQVGGPYVNVVDEVYVRYGVAQDVISLCKARPWWGLVPKASGGVSGGVIDLAGAQHQGLPSHVEIWSREADVGLRYQPVPIEDGILVVRTALMDPHSKEPRIQFASHLRSDRDHESHPLGILGEFSMYRYPERTMNQSTTDKPIDKYNHALKALGYWLYDHFGPVGRASLPKPKRRKYWR